MQTICPHCQTIFKVADEHLKAADGYVRCGICKEVFNALETDQLEDKKEPAIQAEITDLPGAPVEEVIEPDNSDPVEFILEQSNEVNTTENQDIILANDDTLAQKKEITTETTTSNEDAQSDLFSTPSETIEPEVTEPEVTESEAIEAETIESETVETGTEPESIEPIETNNEASDDITNNITQPPSEIIATAASTTSEPDIAETESHSNNSNMDNSLFDGVQSKLIPDEFRIPELHNTYSIWQDLTWSVTILILTASLFVEYAWFNRNELISNPQLSPFITQICSIANCEAMDLREPGQIEMTTRNIYTHPNVKNALMISGTLINHAQFDQPYPNILISFSNVRGEVIASRTFTPENYLQIKSTSLRPLPPRMPIDFNMEIQDPGKHAMTYEFSFL
jgi:predicted Zn finger-like uncharacterized protein